MAGQQTGTPGAPKPGLHVELFEGPVLWRGEKTVRTSPLQDCLLSVVFSWGADRVPRGMVQDLLWDSGSDKSIRHRLSQLVYQINGKCGARILELDREHLCVNRQAVSCDYESFGRMIEFRQFERAYELVDRGFLSALAASKTGALFDWIGDKRQEPRERLASATRAYLDSAGSRREGDQVSTAGGVLLLLKPAREADLRRVMLATSETGRVREAEKVYRAFEARASRSGDWEPGPETATLLQRVRAAAATASSRTGGKDPERDALSVGRSAEERRLSGAILGTERLPGWQTIAIVGDEGVGKTWFVGPILRQARLAGIRVATAAATELESRIPLSLLLEPLNSEWVRPLLKEIQEPWKATIQSLLPRFQEEGGQRASTHQPATDNLSRRTCEALLELFKGMARCSRTILFLDNFHWTDESTRTVLDYMIRRWGPDPFTLLVAYRPEELRLAESTCGTDILSFDPGAMVIKLEGLNAGAARKLVEKESENKLPVAVVERIINLAGGNPRFLADLAVAWASEAPPSFEHAQLSAPPSVHGTLERRFRHLSDHSKAVASSLSVLGITASLPEVIRLSDITRGECVDALQELHNLGLVDWSDGGIEFRYRILGNALYENLGPARRYLLHTRVAELLQSRLDRGPADRIALHYYRAGKHDLAYGFASEFVKQLPNADIDRRLSCLTLAHDASDGLRRRVTALELARLNQRCCRLRAAAEWADALLCDPGGLGEDETGELRLIAADAKHRLGLATTSRTLDDFAAIEEEAARHPNERLRAAVLDATVQLLDRVGDRGSILQQETRIAGLKPMSHPAARSRVLSALSMAATLRDPDAGVRLARQAVQDAREAAEAEELSLALQRLVAALATAGRLGSEDGWATLNEARRVHDDTGHTGAFGLVLLHLTNWQTTTCDYETAQDTLAEAMAVVAEMDCPGIRTLEALVRTNLALAKGDVEGARASLAATFGIVAGATEGDRPPPPIPDTMVLALNGLEGNVLLESGKLGLATQVEEQAPLPGTLQDAPLSLVLFHSRLASRRRQRPAALALLERGMAANEGTRPLVWLSLALEVVRLGRRNKQPQPGLAAKAHATANQLGLPGLAHEFLPFLPRAKE